MDEDTTSLAVAQAAIYPRRFSVEREADPSIDKLREFFTTKGLAALKQEDRAEQWYEDWLTFQAEHHIYASMLSPREFSSLGFQFDLRRLTRFLEVFAYFSPAHGYSFQCTFLGLFAILLGENSALKREAIAKLESGGLLAFGVSEKNRGSDLLGNEFTVTETTPSRYIANGTKFYIGNANSAAIISILAKKENSQASRKRAPFVLLALRPKESKGFCNLRKIHTLGVRCGFVGEFEVKNHELTENEVIAEGRQAWDALFGTITLGKFFLGFGSIGICEHAFEEAVDHVGSRILYGKPVLEMPHIRAAMMQSFVRLTAMKLYAYRALDYVQAAAENDRRYLLFCAVQKAKVSTEGVKTMALLSECVGARGFDADTYFEMALRDIQLIPGLEGSTHINLGMTAQFIPKYFSHDDSSLNEPESLLISNPPAENAYLMQARTGAINTIAFAACLRAYEPLLLIRNVGIFAKQIRTFQLFIDRRSQGSQTSDPRINLQLGQCLATIAYAQLIAENAARLKIPSEMVSMIFHFLISDLSAAALALASMPQLQAKDKALMRRMVRVCKTSGEDWDFVSARLADHRHNS